MTRSVAPPRRVIPAAEFAPFVEALVARPPWLAGSVGYVEAYIVRAVGDVCGAGPTPEVAWREYVEESARYFTDADNGGDDVEGLQDAIVTLCEWAASATLVKISGPPEAVRELCGRNRDPFEGVEIRISPELAARVGE